MEYVQKQHPAICWTKEMIAIQSVNPQYGHDAAGERELSYYIQQLVAEFAEEQGFQVQMETLLRDFALNTPFDDPLVYYAQKTALQCCLKTEPIGVSYGSDASKLQHVAQIPSIVFGPGSILQAHSSEEWVSLHQIEQAAEFFLQLALNFGKEM